MIWGVQELLLSREKQSKSQGLGSRSWRRVFWQRRTSESRTGTPRDICPGGRLGIKKPVSITWSRLSSWDRSRENRSLHFCANTQNTAVCTHLTGMTSLRRRKIQSNGKTVCLAERPSSAWQKPREG